MAGRFGVMVAFATLAFAGCGGEGGDDAEPSTNAAAFMSAVAAGDGEAVCALATPQLAEEITASVKASYDEVVDCPGALAELDGQYAPDQDAYFEALLDDTELSEEDGAAELQRGDATLMALELVDDEWKVSAFPVYANGPLDSDKGKSAPDAEQQEGFDLAERALTAKDPGDCEPLASDELLERASASGVEAALRACEADMRRIGRLTAAGDVMQIKVIQLGPLMEISLIVYGGIANNQQVRVQMLRGVDGSWEVSAVEGLRPPGFLVKDTERDAIRSLTRDGDPVALARCIAKAAAPKTALDVVPVLHGGRKGQAPYDAAREECEQV